MKQAKNSTRRVSTSKSKKINRSAKVTSNKNLFDLSRLKKSYVFGAVAAVFVVAVVASALLPNSSPVSLSSLTGKNTDRVAPKLDTLKGNFSVAGEAASTSLLVKYKTTVSEQSRTNINKQLNAKPKRHIGPLGLDIVQVDSTESVGEIMRQYKSHAEVEYVEPNYLAKRFMTPNDTLFSKQWHLQKIEAPKAWDVSQGGFGPIAVIDTGIAATQTDLSGYVMPGYNFVSDNTDTNDDNGHGTHVAGIVGAGTNNATGVASIGFRGSLMPVKVLDNTGAGTYGDVASGIIYATDNGARILNLSLGGSSSSRTLQDAVKYAVSHGVVVVAAAGNNGNNSAVYPAAYPGVIAVTASDQNDNLASFSSYGSDAYVSAPGVNIISTYNTGGYATMSGTSMAAPVVSGLIGLALSKGTTTVSTVLEDLKSTSDKVGPYAYDSNGWNQYFGYGRINAAKLLGLVATSSTTTPETTTSEPTNPSKPSKPGTRASAANLQFDTVIEGSIDSVDPTRSVVVIKVKSSSSNLQLREGNLIDLSIKPETVFKSAKGTASLQSLKAGDTLQIKAQWKDNQLTGQEVQLVGGSAGQTPPAGDRRRN